MQKKMLVTGGAGFIGTNLVELLIEQQYEVIVVDDLSAGREERLPKEAVFHQLDVRDTDALSAVMEGVEVAFHLAALPSVQFSIEHPLEAHSVNIDGTLCVLEAAKKAGVSRVVLSSSSSVYGDTEQIPTSETASIAPKSPYALHKYMGEELLKLWSALYDVETVSLRLFNVYGPHMDPQGAYAAVVGKFLQLKAEGKPLTITGNGEQTRDFVHVRDAARGFVQAATCAAVGKGEVFNIGSGASVSVNEVARRIGGETAYLPARIEPMHSRADISQAKTVLGWEPQISFEEGIDELKKALS